MKLVLLLLLAINANATVIAFFPLNGDGLDTSGNGRHMTAVGTPSFLGTSCFDISKTMVGPFANNKYYSNSAVNTALLASLNSWKIEFDIHPGDFSSYPTYISAGLAPANIYIGGYASPDRWRFTAGGTDDYSGNTGWAAAKCYHLSYTWDGTTKIMKVNGNTEISNNHSATWTGTNFYVGDYNGGSSSPLDQGYMQNLSIETYSVPATMVPTPVVPTYTSYSGNPVLSPVSAWETTAVSEPRVIVDGNILRMAYTGAWDSPFSIGMATSTDGKTWTRTSANPILGNGYGGSSSDTCRPDLIKTGSTYRIYHYSSAGTGLYQATSTDGVTFAELTYTAVTLASVSGATSLQNSRVYYDGTYYWMMLEAQIVSGSFVSHLLKSIDGGNTYQYIGGPLASLKTGTGMYSVIQPFLSSLFFSGLYHSAPTGNTPTNIYWAYSQGGIWGWNVNSTSVIPLAGNSMGLANPDQVADPFTIYVGNEALTYFAVYQNNTKQAKIGATVDGTSFPVVFSGSGSGPSRTFDRTRR